MSKTKQNREKLWINVYVVYIENGDTTVKAELEANEAVKRFDSNFNISC
jgi:hypothetical protein